VKQFVKNYTFSVSAKTVTLTDYTSNGVVLERLQLIVDTTVNKIIYNFADNTVATAVISSSNVITLSTLPSGLSNSDTLQIIYQNQIGDPYYDTTIISDGSDIVTQRFSVHT
jgi:hypothetical protein